MGLIDSWLCGSVAVFSVESAQNELQMTDKCLVCGTAATKEDIVCLD